MKNKCDFNLWPDAKIEPIGEPIPVRLYFPKTVEEIMERFFIEVDENEVITDKTWNISPELQADEKESHDQ